jgi:hypothetical protein
MNAGDVAHVAADGEVFGGFQMFEGFLLVVGDFGVETEVEVGIEKA